MFFVEHQVAKRPQQIEALCDSFSWTIVCFLPLTADESIDGQSILMARKMKIRLS